LSPPLPLSLAPIKPANLDPGASGKMAVKTEKERERELSTVVFSAVTVFDGLLLLLITFI